MPDGERTTKYELDPLDPKKVAVPKGADLEEHKEYLRRVAWGVMETALTDPRYYNCGKTAQGLLLGMGDLQKGADRGSSGIYGGWILVATKEELAELVKLGNLAIHERDRQRAIEAGVERERVSVPGPSSEQPALVGSQRNQDV